VLGRAALKIARKTAPDTRLLPALPITTAGVTIDIAGLAETFADLAGVPPLSFADGRSLKGLLQNPPTTAWRQSFLLEEFGTGEFDPPDTAASVLEPLDKMDLATVVPIPSYSASKRPEPLQPFPKNNHHDALGSARKR